MTDDPSKGPLMQRDQRIRQLETTLWYALRWIPAEFPGIRKEVRDVAKGDTDESPGGSW